MSFQVETFVQNSEVNYLKRARKCDLVEVGSQYSIRLDKGGKKCGIFMELFRALVEEDILPMKAMEQISASPDLEAQIRLKELEVQIEAQKIEA